MLKKWGHGKGVYISATYLSAPAIDQIREYIKENVLLPYETEVRKHFGGYERRYDTSTNDVYKTVNYQNRLKCFT